MDSAQEVDPAPALPEEEVGFLRILTTPPTEVVLSKRLIGSTPVKDMKLPPGRYKAILLNREEKIRQVIQFTIRSGEVTSVQYVF